MNACLAAYLCAFLMSVASIMFWVGLPYLAMDWFAAGPLQLGLLGGSSAGTYVVTCLLAGRIARRMRLRHMIAAGAFILATATMTATFAWSIGVLMVLSATMGFGHGLFWPSLETHLSAGVGSSELRHRVGWFNFSWSAGDVVGCALGGVLHNAFSRFAGDPQSRHLQSLPFLGSTLIGAVIAVLALRYLRLAPESRTWRDGDDHQVPRSPGRGGAAGLAVFWTLALIANWGASAFRGILQNVFPDMGKDLLGYSALEWGLLIAVLPLTRTLMFLYWQRHHGWSYKARYLFGFQLLLPLAAIVCVFNSSYWVFLVAFGMVGVGMSKTYFSSLYYGLDSDHSHQSRGGIHEAVLGSGGALGPPLAGLAARASGEVRAPYVFAFAFLALSMIVQAWMYLARRRG